jgi:hypothetical protein
MSENIIQNEFNVSALFSQLYKAKKIVIFIVFISTLLAGLFAMQMKPIYNSTALIEFGSYDVGNNEERIIESSESFMRNFKINLFFKNELNLTENVSVSPIEKSLIRVNVYSDSDKKNILVYNKLLTYVQGRHQEIFDQINQSEIIDLNSNILLIDDEIEFSESLLQDQNEAEIINISFLIEQLKNQLPFFDKQIINLEQIISDDNENLELLKSSPTLYLERASTNPTLNQVIYSYKRKLNELRQNKQQISTTIIKLKNELKNIENTNLQSEKLFELFQEKNKIENRIKLIENRKFINSNLIKDVSTTKSNKSQLLIILFGLFFGFFTSIFYVLISNYLSLGKSKST